MPTVAAAVMPATSATVTDRTGSPLTERAGERQQNAHARAAKGRAQAVADLGDGSRGADSPQFFLADQALCAGSAGTATRGGRNTVSSS